MSSPIREYVWVAMSISSRKVNTKKVWNKFRKTSLDKPNAAKLEIHVNLQGVSETSIIVILTSNKSCQGQKLFPIIFFVRPVVYKIPKLPKKFATLWTCSKEIATHARNDRKKSFSVFYILNDIMFVIVEYLFIEIRDNMDLLLFFMICFLK